MERLENGPIHPKLCLKNSFSGSKGISVKKDIELAISPLLSCGLYRFVGVRNVRDQNG